MVRSKSPSTRSERPQSSSRRSGSRAGSSSRRRSRSAGRISLGAAPVVSGSGGRARDVRSPAIGAPFKQAASARDPPQYVSPVRTKDQVRAAVWRAMDREGVSRFPGAEGRIPNFAGAKQAAERLARHPDWIRATTIKANPDSPQTHVRRMALAQGKCLVMAVPRLRDEHPFRLLDPRKLSEERSEEHTSE